MRAIVCAVVLCVFASVLFAQDDASAAGDDAEDLCQVACNACARCVSAGAPGLLEMVNNLPVIDYEKNDLASPEAVGRCPTGAIVWLEGQQFADTLELVRSAKE